MRSSFDSATHSVIASPTIMHLWFDTISQQRHTFVFSQYENIEIARGHDLEFVSPDGITSSEWFGLVFLDPANYLLWDQVQAK